MLKRYQRSSGVIIRLADVFAVGLGWILAYPLRFYVFHWISNKGIPDFHRYLTLIPLLLAIWAAVFSGFGVYSHERFLRRTEEILQVWKAHGFSFLAFLSLTFLITEFRYSRVVMLVFGILSALFLWAFRIAIRVSFREMARQGKFRFNLAWIGTGGDADDMIRWLSRYPEFGIIPHRFIKDSELNELREIVLKEKIQTLLVFQELGGTKRIEATMLLMKSEPIDVWFVPSLEKFLSLGAQVTQFRGIPVMELNASPLATTGILLKRAIDLMVSSLALVLLSPVFALIAIITKFTSPGSVFYSQERMGVDGKVFSMHKFRSMHLNAEEKTGAVWADADDERKTKWGAFLRSTSLDELPQLWNILKGEMSLVGPRPERPVFVQQFKAQIPNYMLRHKMRAGLTGWAQINGWRGNTSLEKRIEYDLYYIRNWSLFLDFKIILITFFKGFINKNAY